MTEAVNYSKCDCLMAVPSGYGVMKCQVNQFEEELGHKPTAKEILELKARDWSFIHRLCSIPVNNCPHGYEPLRF